MINNGNYPLQKRKKIMIRLPESKPTGSESNSPLGYQRYQRYQSRRLHWYGLQPHRL